MEVPQEIQGFETQIAPVILQRGKDYYEDGNIVEVTELMKDTFELIVEGSYEYKVNIELIATEIVSYDCDCPYDRGPICKHVVAALYYLREIEGVGEPKAIIEKVAQELPKQSKEKPKKKRKTVKEKIEALLEEASMDELKAFVLKQALEDTHFRRLVELSFVLEKDRMSRSFYKKQIKAILRSAEDRTGFIDWRSVGNVRRQVAQILREGQEQLAQQHFYNVFLIGTVVLEEITLALNFADDSNGDIGNIIYVALDHLQKLSKINLPSKTRKAFFDYCLKTFDQAKFEGWDWHWDLLDFASELFENKKEATQLMATIDKKNYQNYRLEMIQKIKYELIEKVEGKEQANLYLEQNIQNPNLRRKALQKAFDLEDYERVLTLAKDGVEWDEKDKPGLVAEWEKWLLKVAQAKNDTVKIIEYARYFFLDSFTSRKEYYQLMKQTLATEDWLPFMETLIVEVKSMKTWRKRELLTYIYIEEQRWASLLELLKTQVSFDLLHQYEPYLKKAYSTDLVALYAAEILDYSKKNAGRGSYQVLCQNIRRIQKLGDVAKAKELIDLLRTTYPQRPALLDELNKL